jgi:hypothetical protein
MADHYFKIKRGETTPIYINLIDSNGDAQTITGQTLGEFSLTKRAEEKPILSFNTSDDADTIIDVDESNKRVEIFLTEAQSFDLPVTIVDGKRIAPPLKAEAAITVSGKRSFTKTIEVDVEESIIAFP